MNIRDILLAQQQKTARFEPKRGIISCEMVGVDATNTPAVSGRPGYVWVREFGQGGGVFQCFNPHVQDRVGLTVLVGPDPQNTNRRVVLGVDWQTIVVGSAYEGEPYLANHASSHEWPDFTPGPDAVSVYPRSFAQLRMYAGSGALEVSVSPYRYNKEGTVQEFVGETDIDMTSHIPDSGWRFVLVYLDTDTNTIKTLEGAAATLIDSAVKPDCPIGHIPSAYIALVDSTALINESLIYDARMPFDETGQGIEGTVNMLAWVEAELDYDITRHIVGP